MHREDEKNKTSHWQKEGHTKHAMIFLRHDGSRGGMHGHSVHSPSSYPTPLLIRPRCVRLELVSLFISVRVLVYFFLGSRSCQPLPSVLSLSLPCAQAGPIQLISPRGVCIICNVDITGSSRQPPQSKTSLLPVNPQLESVLAVRRSLFHARQRGGIMSSS